MLVSAHRSLFSSRKARSATASNADQPTMRNRAILRVEQREDRSVPATFQVTNLLADGAGSLRKAVTDLNASQDQFNQIQFQQGLTGTISTTAQLQIQKTVDIQAPGSSALTVQRSTAQETADFRVFLINTDVVVNLSGITIKNGYAKPNDFGGSGGGILNLGNLALTDVKVEANTAVNGAGIANYGSLSLENSFIVSNIASSAGGGLYNAGTAVVVGDVYFLSNEAWNGGGCAAPLQ